MNGSWEGRRTGETDRYATRKARGTRTRASQMLRRKESRPVIVHRRRDCGSAIGFRCRSGTRSCCGSTGRCDWTRTSVARKTRADGPIASAARVSVGRWWCGLRGRSAVCQTGTTIGAPVASFSGGPSNRCSPAPEFGSGGTIVATCEWTDVRCGRCWRKESGTPQSEVGFRCRRRIHRGYDSGPCFRPNERSLVRHVPGCRTETGPTGRACPLGQSEPGRTGPCAVAECVAHGGRRCPGSIAQCGWRLGIGQNDPSAQYGPSEHCHVSDQFARCGRGPPLRPTTIGVPGGWRCDGLRWTSPVQWWPRGADSLVGDASSCRRSNSGLRSNNCHRADRPPVRTRGNTEIGNPTRGGSRSTASRSGR